MEARVHKDTVPSCLLFNFIFAENQGSVEKKLGLARGMVGPHACLGHMNHYFFNMLCGLKKGRWTVSRKDGQEDLLEELPAGLSWEPCADSIACEQGCSAELTGHLLGSQYTETVSHRDSPRLDPQSSSPANSHHCNKNKYSYRPYHGLGIDSSTLTFMISFNTQKCPER